ncbi:MAG: hypothetical protein ACJ8G3_17620 [Burkholderiaceae bacterium]
MQKTNSFDSKALSDLQLDLIAAAGFDPNVFKEITRQAREDMRDGYPAQYGPMVGRGS